MGRHTVRRSRRGRQPLDFDPTLEPTQGDAWAVHGRAEGGDGDERAFAPSGDAPLASGERPIGGIGAHLAEEALARREAKHAVPEPGDGQDMDLQTPAGDSARERVANRRKAKRTGSKAKVALAVIGVLAVLGAVGVMGAFAYLRGLQADTQDKSAAVVAALAQKARTPGPPVNILVLGSDIRMAEVRRGETKARSDTIMVVRIDPKKKKAWVLSFPRDLRVDIPGYGTDKINAAYFFGGPPLVIKTINELTGLPINDYVEVSFEGFRELVDAIGGVWMNVEPATTNNPGYVNRWGRDIYDIKAANHKEDAALIKPGYQKLDGRHALTYVRSRYAYIGGDFDRIKHQQQFMDALLAQTVRFQNVFRLPQMIEVFRRNVRTSMGLGELTNLAFDMRGIKRKDLEKARIEGQDAHINGIYYYLPNEEQIAVVTQRMRSGEPFGGPATGGNIPNEEISIVVRNGSGKSGRGKSMGDRLVVMGFDVKDVGSAKESNYVSTLIVYKPAHQAEAAQIQRALGIGKLQPDPTGKYSFTSDVLIVVGQDYRPAGGGSSAASADEPGI